jgi:hypothetical protein
MKEFISRFIRLSGALFGIVWASVLMWMYIVALSHEGQVLIDVNSKKEGLIELILITVCALLSCVSFLLIFRDMLKEKNNGK